MILPTSKEEIFFMLRQLGMPITQFGETIPDRVNRLKDELVKRGLDANDLREQLDQQNGPEENPQDLEEFYVLASEELMERRRQMAVYSFARGERRVSSQRLLLDKLEEFEKYERCVADQLALMKDYHLVGSQYGGSRSLSSCSVSPDDRWLATSCWNGETSVWDTENFQLVHVVGLHDERVYSVDWHPRSGLDVPRSGVNLLSGGGDSMDSRHQGRVTKVGFHPIGDVAVSVSDDQTFALWDVQTQQNLMFQTGHQREVHGLAFHPDGSLLATGDLGGIGLVWDLRAGLCIHSLQGHIKGIIDVDFSINGYHIATCSDDNTVMLWDLRKRACLYTLPAHSHMISRVSFSPRDGEFLLTSSFDNTCKVWSLRTFECLSLLQGHEGKVTGACFSLNERNVFTCSLDRTWKKYSVST